MSKCHIVGNHKLSAVEKQFDILMAWLQILLFLFSEAAHIISDIAKAIHYLHSMNIAHRDLKVIVQF